MINLFVLQKGRLAQEQVDDRNELLLHKPIWIDVVDPDDEELAWIKEAYGVALPELDKDQGIAARAALGLAAVALAGSAIGGRLTALVAFAGRAPALFAGASS